MTRPRLVLVGSGGRAYREYAFEALAGEVELCAVLSAEPTWQAEHLHTWRVADTADAAEVTAAVGELLTDDCGVLTWDELALEATAAAAAAHGLPHMSPDAARGCRDKLRTRSAMAAAGCSPVRHAVAASLEEALEAADAIGYPVVLKPRALAGSIGVSIAATPDDVRDRFATAADATYATLPAHLGVLVEEYLDGPEISVESVVADGDVRVVQAVHKIVGFEPWFEEVGHVVGHWRDEPWAGAVRELVVAAHEAIGVTHGVTHAEVRLTSAGPRLVELNGRIAGDLIGHLVHLTTGVDLVRAAADVALGRSPQVGPPAARGGEVAFVYPDTDVRVEDVDVTAALRMPGVVDARPVAAAGDTLLLPPRQAIPRLAAVLVVEDDPRLRATMLHDAVAAVRATTRELAPVGSGAP